MANPILDFTIDKSSLNYIGEGLQRPECVLTTASGDLFVFKNRRGDKLKILAWMGDGFALYLRRLEQGTFAFPTGTTPELVITATQLAMILGGIELTQSRTRKRFQQTA